MSRTRATWLIVFILTLGSLLRLYHARAIGGHYSPHVDREEGYYEAGIAQLSCHSLAQIPDTAPSAFRAPLYPSFLALIESFFVLPSPYHPRLAQVLLGTLAVATACLLGWLLLSPLAGVLSGVLLAFNVDDILSVSSLNVHGFYGIAMLALGASLVLWLERRDFWRTGLLGLMLAATLLCRPAHFPFPLLLAAACLWHWKFPEGRWRALLSVGACTALFLAPMAIRNGLQFGSYSPFDLKGSYVLLRSTVGPHLNTTVEQALDVAESMEPGFKARGLDARPLHKELIRLALRQIARTPVKFSLYCLERLFLFWRGLWFYLALAAYVLWRRRKDKFLEALILTTASLSGYALAGGTAEYRVTAVPLLCVVAGVALASLPQVKSAPAVTGSMRGLLRSGILVLPAVFVVIYAAMCVFLALELREHLRPGPEPVLVAPCPDGRALHVLKISAMQAGGRGVAAVLYANTVNSSRTYPPTQEKNPLGPTRYWIQRAESQIRNGALQAGLASLARAEASSPDSPGKRRIAVLYRQAEDFHRASILMEALLQRQPKDASLWLERADLELGMGKPDAALQSIARAMALSPDDAIRRRVIGLYRIMKESSRAAALLDPMLVRLPKDSGLWLERAEIEAQMGKRDEALKSLVQAEELTLGRPDANGEKRSRIAHNYQSMGEHGRAIAILDGLTREYPAEGAFYSDKGLCQYLKGDAVAAIRNLEIALRLKPKFIPAYLTLGAIYTAKGRYREALKLYDAGLARNPVGSAYPLRETLQEERKKILTLAGMLK